MDLGVRVVLWSLLSLVAMQDAGERKAIELAKAEVGRAAGASVDAMTVVDASPRQWRETSLGCPQPGMLYAPVLTSGYLIKLRVGSKPYTVHVGNGRAVLCGSARPDDRDTKLRRGDTTEGLKLAEQARNDLARELNIPPARITIDFYRPATWPDQRLGCGKPPPLEAKPVRGFLIQLTANGRTFEYRASADHGPLRCDQRRK